MMLDGVCCTLIGFGKVPDIAEDRLRSLSEHEQAVLAEPRSRYGGFRNAPGRTMSGARDHGYVQFMQDSSGRCEAINAIVAPASALEGYHRANAVNVGKLIKFYMECIVEVRRQCTAAEKRAATEAEVYDGNVRDFKKMEMPGDTTALFLRLAFVGRRLVLTLEINGETKS